MILIKTNGSSMDLYKNARLGTRIVQTRNGRLQGMILPLENYKFLKPVEVFLGVPYATPPVKLNRVNLVPKSSFRMNFGSSIVHQSKIYFKYRPPE
uniref:CSON003162 protein n=1 Tax=Culicoides sonorensis TaxID=179676 RepID=A0A336L0Y0_CULSO